MERIRQKAEESQASKSSATADDDDAEGTEGSKDKDEDEEDEADVKERSQCFAERYTAFLDDLADCPSARGILTVRCILEAQQHVLREFGIPDAFCNQKKVNFFHQVLHGFLSIS